MPLLHVNGSSMASSDPSNSLTCQVRLLSIHSVGGVQNMQMVTKVWPHNGHCRARARMYLKLTIEYIEMLGHGAHCRHGLDRI